MDATVFILKELQEIKEQLQNISDALKPKKHFCDSSERGLHDPSEDYDQPSMKKPY